MNTGHMDHPFRALARNAGAVFFRFTTTATANVAASVVDPGGLLSAVTAHTHPSAGVYVFPLAKRWKYIFPESVNLAKDTTATWGKISALVEGPAAENSVTVYIGNAAGATDIPAGEVVTVVLLMMG